MQSLNILKSLAATALKGPDTRKFLQGQLTCDINELSPTQPLKGAHCNREGRVVALYDILEQEDTIILITQRKLMNEAIKTLKHYGMFSKITWEDLSNSHEILLEQGRLHIKPKDEVTDLTSDETEFYYQKILNKQAFLTPETIGKFLPQELALSGSALSFTKGCYLGQEVVARLHYLGKLKHTLRMLESDHGLKPLAELLAQDQVVGEVVVSIMYQQRCYGLGLVNTNYQGTTVLSGGQEVNLKN